MSVETGAGSIAYWTRKIIRGHFSCKRLSQDDGSNPFQLAAGGIYVNVSHHGLVNLSAFLPIKENTSMSSIFFIHDLIPIEHPDLCRAGDYEKHEIRLSCVSACADLVLFNSASTQNSFGRFFKKNGYCLPNSEVIHIGVEPIYEGRAHEPFKKDNELFFISLGTIDPRKNHLILLKVWKQLVLDCEDVPPLIIIGKPRKWFSGVTKYLNDNPEIITFVKIYAECRDEEVINYLANARALLMPSFAEGWGMPIVEALTLGTTVIASDIAAHQEASQGVAQLIDPYDVDAWYAAIHSALLNDKNTNPSEEKKRFRPPTWNEHFQRVDELISTL